jgi:hypothetical protein
MNKDNLSKIFNRRVLKSNNSVSDSSRSSAVKDFTDDSKFEKFEIL